MKALGAGAGVAALGGVATAQSGDDDGGVEAADDGGNAVHEVLTLIGPPTHPERPADFYYQPTGLHVQPGDVVRFRFVTPDHNVVSMHPAYGMRRRVPTGVDAFSSPLLGFESIPDDQVEPPELPMEGSESAGGDEGGTQEADDGESEDGPDPATWLRAFETPGVYDLICSPHEAFGMAMRVVVGDETDAAFETSDPEALPEPRAGPVGLARVTLTDPALEPETVVEQGAVAWEDLEAWSDAAAEEETPAGTPAETPAAGDNETDGNLTSGTLTDENPAGGNGSGGS